MEIMTRAEVEAEKILLDVQNEAYIPSVMVMKRLILTALEYHNVKSEKDKPE